MSEQHRVKQSPSRPAHEAIAHADLRARMVGEGEMPSELDVFSWGAFFFSLLWAIRYAVWRVVVFVGLAVCAWLIFDRLALSIPTAVWLAAWAVFELALGAVVLWLGVNGHRLMWNVAARRVGRGLIEPKTVGDVLDGQVWWAGFGWVLSAAAVVVQVTGLPQVIGIQRPQVLAGLVLQIGILALAVYLSRVRGLLWRLLSTS